MAARRGRHFLYATYRRDKPVTNRSIRSKLVRRKLRGKLQRAGDGVRRATGLLKPAWKALHIEIFECLRHKARPLGVLLQTTAYGIGEENTGGKQTGRFTRMTMTATAAARLG